MDELPAIPLELLEALEFRYPNQAPNIRDNPRFVWFKAGQAELVRFLRTAYEQQTDNKLGV